MKPAHFVDGLSNNMRFLDGIRHLEARGAREANIMLVKGSPGYGKSKALLRYSVQNGCILVRAKADWTPSWALRDLCAALDINTSGRKQVMFDAICLEMMAKGLPALIVDEIDHAARDIRVLETLRDISDSTECVFIMGGMKDAEALMKRHPQIHSRIAHVVTFGPATAEDVGLLCGELSDVTCSPEMIEHVHKVTGGNVRLIMNAIARVDATFRKNRGETVTLEKWGNRQLLNEHRPAA